MHRLRFGAGEHKVCLYELNANAFTEHGFS